MQFRCKENCGECCGIVPIKKEIWEKHKQKKQREIKEIKEIKDEVYIICEGLKCVFLRKEDKKCMIYSDRPQVCRNYGIGKLDALSCPYLKPSGRPRSPAMIKRVQRMINHDVDAMMRRIEKW